MSILIPEFINVLKCCFTTDAVWNKDAILFSIVVQKAPESPLFEVHHIFFFLVRFSFKNNIAVGGAVVVKTTEKKVFHEIPYIKWYDE